MDEIQDLLSAEEAEAVIQAYHLQEAGNFRDEATKQRTGENILHQLNLSGPNGQPPIPEDQFAKTLSQAREKLFNARLKRIRPQLDDDYAFLNWGLLNLYENTEKRNYLHLASRLNKHILQHFQDPEIGGCSSRPTMRKPFRSDPRKSLTEPCPQGTPRLSRTSAGSLPPAKTTASLPHCENRSWLFPGSSRNSRPGSRIFCAVWTRPLRFWIKTARLDKLKIRFTSLVHAHREQHPLDVCVVPGTETTKQGQTYAQN